jgi:hypothetical protein
LFSADSRDQYGGFRHGDHNRAVCLTGNPASLQCYFVFTVLKCLFDRFHNCSRLIKMTGNKRQLRARFRVVKAIRSLPDAPSVI